MIIARLGPQSPPAGHELGRCHRNRAVSAAFRKNSRLPPALRDDDLESGKLSFVALCHSASIPEEHQAPSLFSVEELKFPRELVWVQEAHQYSKKHTVKNKLQKLPTGGAQFQQILKRLLRLQEVYFNVCTTLILCLNSCWRFSEALAFGVLVEGLAADGGKPNAAESHNQRWRRAAE